MILLFVVLIFLGVPFLKKNGFGIKITEEEWQKKRYARGEISKEEFERIMRDIMP